MDLDFFFFFLIPARIVISKIAVEITIKSELKGQESHTSPSKKIGYVAFIAFFF